MNKQQLQWAVTAIVRLIVGYVAVRLGWDAATQAATVTTVSGAIVAAILVAVSLWSSLRSRAVLQLSCAPPQLDLEPFMEGPRPPPEFRGNGMGVPGTQRLVRVLLWFGWDVQADMDRLAARFHDWGYLTGGNPTVAEVAAWRAARVGRVSIAETDGSFFAGGNDYDKLRIDGYLELNTRTILYHRWGRLKWFFLGRLYVDGVFRAVRDLGDKAFHFAPQAGMSRPPATAM